MNPEIFNDARKYVATRLAVAAIIGFASLSSGCRPEGAGTNEGVFPSPTPVLSGEGPRSEPTLRVEEKLQSPVLGEIYSREQISSEDLTVLEKETGLYVSGLLKITVKDPENSEEVTDFCFIKTTKGASFYVTFEGGPAERFVVAVTEDQDGRRYVDYAVNGKNGEKNEFLSYGLTAQASIQDPKTTLSRASKIGIRQDEVVSIAIGNPHTKKALTYERSSNPVFFQGLLQALSVIPVYAQEPEHTPTPKATSTPLPTATVRPTETASPTRTATKPPEPTKSPTELPTMAPTKQPPTVVPENQEAKKVLVSENLSQEYSFEKVRVGESALGNPIEVELIGQPENPQAPIVWFIAGIHPSEGTAKRANLLRKWYLENPGTWRGFRLAFSNVNPDGKGKVNPNGVNLNRNADFDWKKPAGKGDDCSAQGSAPESEPEARAIMNAADELKNRGEVVFSIVFHAEGRIIDPFVCPDSNSGSCAVSKIVAQELGFFYMEVWRVYGCEDGHPQGLAGQVDDALAQKKGLAGCTLEYGDGYNAQPGEAEFIGRGLMRALNSYFYP